MGWMNRGCDRENRELGLLGCMVRGAVMLMTICSFGLG